MDDFENQLIETERKINEVDQYGRRENFEISGIPDSIPNENLEEKVINIVNKITERQQENKITAKDIHSCHRLKKEKGEKEHKIIVRMVNRKDAYDVKSNRKKLMNKAKEMGFQQNLYINDNLNQESKEIFATARKLKNNELIYGCWSYNGHIYIKKNEDDNSGLKIGHMESGGFLYHPSSSRTWARGGLCVYGRFVF